MRVCDSRVISGLKMIHPDIFYDYRGEYVETYSEREYAFEDLDGRPIEFVEDDISVSCRHVLRGLHGDGKTWKLVQCLHGAIHFVVVDMREQSDTYLRWESFALNDNNRHQVLVPAGCANGHLVLSDECVFSYKQSEYYAGSAKQFVVRWDDPKIAIAWPVTQPPLLSERDANAPSL